MTVDALPPLHGFSVFDVRDPADMDERSRISGRFPGSNRANTYTLRDRALRQSGAQALLTRFAIRRVGELQLSHVADRFGTEVLFVDPGMDGYCFSMMHTGRVALLGTGGSEFHLSSMAAGLVYRGHPGTRLLTEDSNARSNLWISASRLECALQARLGDGLRGQIEFCPEVDWTNGVGPGLRRLMLHLAEELGRPEGLASNTLARSAYIDLFVHTALQGIPNSYAERLQRCADGPAPRHLRRAEEYLHEHADKPTLMEDVAAASGCSVRALERAFREFRGTTPYAALQQVRLELARGELARDERSVVDVARRYGFTNRSRFAAAYMKRFGERPSETARGKRN
jgi:AraC-like DNA-binding protein